MRSPRQEYRDKRRPARWNRVGHRIARPIADVHAPWTWQSPRTQSQWASSTAKEPGLRWQKIVHSPQGEAKAEEADSQNRRAAHPILDQVEADRTAAHIRDRRVGHKGSAEERKDPHTLGPTRRHNKAGREPRKAPEGDRAVAAPRPKFRDRIPTRRAESRKEAVNSRERDTIRRAAGARRWGQAANPKEAGSLDVEGANRGMCKREGKTSNEGARPPNTHAGDQSTVPQVLQHRVLGGLSVPQTGQ